MRVGDRVEVHAHWSSFHGMQGVVTSITPHVMILLDGDRCPIRVGEREVQRVVVEPHIGGAE